MSHTMVDILRERSMGDPGGRAYVFLADGDEQLSLTYREVHDQVLGNAARIAAAAEPGERAVILCPPGPQFVVAFYACLAAGLVAVPASLYDPTRVRRGLERLAGILEDCAPSVVVTTSEMSAGMEEALDAAPALKQCARVVINPAVVPGPNQDAPTPAPGDTAMLQYTSGSTSEPKGVVLTHRNLMANVAAIAERFEADSETVVVSWLPTFHDMGLMLGVLLPVYTGGVSVLMPPADFIRKPARWLEAITTYRGTVAGGPNFAYELCRRHVDESTRATLDLSSWDVAFCGAEPVRAQTMEGFAEDFARSGFSQASLLPGYGLAEATLMVSGGPIRQGARWLSADRAALGAGILQAPEQPSHAHQLVDVGAAAPGVDIRIVDPNTGTECSEGTVGEVWVAGPSVAQGYWHNPTATKEVFGRVMPGTDKRFLRTGDLGLLAGGRLHITGRAKDVIINEGQNIYPQDLELTAEGAAVQLRLGGCAAFQEPDGGATVLVAEVDDRSAPEDYEGVVKRARGSVARVHGVTVSRMVLITSRSLPKTSSGKIQRTRCRLLLASGELPVLYDWPTTTAAPTSRNDGRQEEDVTALEAEILDTCEKIIGIRPRTRDEHLSQLGGGSLGLIRLINQINKRFGCTVTANEAFQSLTVGGLAQTVQAARHRHAPAPQAGDGRDLSSDMIFDPAITLPADRALASARNPKEVLLTGATGFVGAFLLNELLTRTRAEIHCLVRARTAADGLARLAATLDRYGMPSANLDRVAAVPADLSRRQYGLPTERFSDLAARVDTVIHSAASVSAIQSYDTLHAPNVLGTQEVIRFATCERLKRVHHISTLAALHGLGDWYNAHALEQPVATPPRAQHTLSGYPRSKWAAEQLIHAAGQLGVPVSIYRLARVSGDTEGGFWADSDLWRRALAGSIRAGALPDAEWVDIWTPVDFVAQAVIAIALNPRANGRIVHLAQSPSLRLADLAQWLTDCGYPLRTLPWQEWTDALAADADNPMGLLLPHLRGHVDTHPGHPPGDPADTAAAADLLPTGDKILVDTSSAQELLEGTGIECPPAGPALLGRYLDRMVREGLIPPPAAAAHHSDRAQHNETAARS
ncbi:thioester reductase domain-containing protein [Streptomyces sp. 7N604]|uniref:thioester reductase domain-containing protein n=1 Tax=Streptomyces sp. 7N604 TaxID=3457415 RepID=UPI003FD4E9DF